MPARNRSKQNNIPKKAPQRLSDKSSKLSDFLNFSESYSSLILGIVVVIITTVLLIVLVRDRSTVQRRSLARTVSSVNTVNRESVTDPATQSPTNPVSTPTSIPTVQPTASPTSTPIPTAEPTKVWPTNTQIPTLIITQKSVLPSQTVRGNEKVHTVVQGETLWSVAEKYYKSGYNWVDIAEANRLNNPDLINAGMKLTIPNVAAKQVTIANTQTPEQQVYGPKITGNTYKVQKGDHLWGIAVRAYADGYKWVDIARVNNITSPNSIEAGMTFKIPRTGR